MGAILHGRIPIPSTVAGQKPIFRLDNALDVPHIFAVTPSKPLIRLSVHLPHLSFQSLCNSGVMSLYSNTFESADTLSLVLLTSQGEVPWCGRRLHYRLLGAISESCIVVGDQCSYPHPSL